MVRRRGRSAASARTTRSARPCWNAAAARPVTPTCRRRASRLRPARRRSRAACRTADLRLAAGEGDAGTGNRAQILTLTNAGTAPCTLSGYPSVSLLDANGRAVTGVRADQNPGTAAPVTLPAGGRAFFDIAWNVVPNEAQGQTTCPTAARVTVRLGGDTATLAVPLSLTPCGGRIRVNPVRATEEIAATPDAA
jgi:hypothetical protein